MSEASHSEKKHINTATILYPKSPWAFSSKVYDTDLFRFSSVYIIYCWHSMVIQNHQKSPQQCGGKICRQNLEIYAMNWLHCCTLATWTFLYPKTTLSILSASNSLQSYSHRFISILQLKYHLYVVTVQWTKQRNSWRKPWNPCNELAALLYISYIYICITFQQLSL